MLAAPEFIVAKRVELLDQIEIPAVLQHRMLADGMMRGEEGSELEARHGVSPDSCSFVLGPNYGAERGKAIAESRRRCMVVVRGQLTYRRPEFSNS
jgi:hypothetical protein